MKSPFKEPSENEEKFNEMIKRDNPFPVLKCICGEEYTTEMHTVCPKCYRWPKYAKTKTA